MLGSQGRHYCLWPQIRPGSGVISSQVFFVNWEEWEDCQSEPTWRGGSWHRPRTRVKRPCKRNPLFQESKKELRGASSVSCKSDLVVGDAYLLDRPFINAPGGESHYFHTPPFPDSKEREGDRK